MGDTLRETHRERETETERGNEKIGEKKGAKGGGGGGGGEKETLRNVTPETAVEMEGGREKGRGERERGEEETEANAINGMRCRRRQRCLSEVHSVHDFSALLTRLLHCRLHLSVREKNRTSVAGTVTVKPHCYYTRLFLLQGKTRTRSLGLRISRWRAKK